jgi:hypothetical protein
MMPWQWEEGFAGERELTVSYQTTVLSFMFEQFILKVVQVTLLLFKHKIDFFALKFGKCYDSGS